MRLGFVRPRGPRLAFVLCGLFLIHQNATFAAAAPNRQTDLVETSQGTLKIRPLFHGSVTLDFGGKIIQIDPWSQAERKSLLPAPSRGGCLRSVSSIRRL